MPQCVEQRPHGASVRKAEDQIVPAEQAAIRAALKEQPRTPKIANRLSVASEGDGQRSRNVHSRNEMIGPQICKPGERLDVPSQSVLGLAPGVVVFASDDGVDLLRVAHASTARAGHKGRLHDLERRYGGW